MRNVSLLVVGLNQKVTSLMRMLCGIRKKKLRKMLMFQLICPKKSVIKDEENEENSTQPNSLSPKVALQAQVHHHQAQLQ